MTGPTDCNAAQPGLGLRARRFAPMIRRAALLGVAMAFLPRPASAEECVMFDAGTTAQSNQGASSQSTSLTACGSDAQANGAQAEAPFPPEPGQTGYALRAASFRGQQAFSLGLAHRLKVDVPIMVNASISHANGKNTGASVGIAGIF